jgi:chaperonin cofactor prefoldin
MDEQQLQTRLQQLTAESSRGQQRLHQLDRERRSIEQTLLRIDGAMALLKEFLDADDDVAVDADNQQATRLSVL